MSTNYSSEFKENAVKLAVESDQPSSSFLQPPAAAFS